MEPKCCRCNEGSLYPMIMLAGSEGSDQTAWVRRLIWAILSRMNPKTRILTARPLGECMVNFQNFEVFSFYLFSLFLIHLLLNKSFLILLLLNTTCPVLANSEVPDQLASEEANWSGSALFVIKYVTFSQKPGLSNLIGWEIRSGRGILIYSAWEGLMLFITNSSLLSCKYIVKS